jgi:hypothetical protein
VLRFFGSRAIQPGASTRIRWEHARLNRNDDKRIPKQYCGRQGEPEQADGPSEAAILEPERLKGALDAVR